MPQPVVELYRTIERANASAKAAAVDAGTGAAFGVRRLTVPALIEELWDLWGDGRALVSADERNVLVGALLAERGEQVGLQTSAGTIRLLARFFARVGCLVDGCGTAAVEFTAREGAVLDMAACYCERLHERGLVELEQAAAILARMLEAGDMPPIALAVVDADRFGAGVEALLRAAGGVGPDAHSGLFLLPDAVEEALVLPAGPTVLAGLLLDEIEDCIAAGDRSILVVFPQADELFDVLAGPLAERGAAAALRCSCPFGETLVGHALAAAERIGGSHLAECAADFGYNRLSGAQPRDVQRLNRAIREDRCAGPETVLQELRAIAPAFDAFAAISGALNGKVGDAAGAFDALAARIAGDAGLSPAERKREAAALEKIRGLLEARARVGGAACPVGLLLEAVSVPVQVAIGDCAPSVEFASMERLDSLVAATYDTVIVADLSQAAFPARAETTALDGLAEKLGYGSAADEFERERIRFAAALEAARRRFTIAISQRDEGGEETYPAFLLSEYADSLVQAAESTGNAAYACDWSARDKGAFDLPAPFVRGARRAGEESLVRGVGRNFAAPTNMNEVLPAVRGTLRGLRLTDFLKHAPGAAGDALVLSPSAMEAYLGCPYGWFLQRRIRPNPPDEQFGAAEKGSFVHSVLARFYDELAAEGITRVDAGNLAACECRLDDVFDRCAAQQYAGEPGSGRLVARSKSEKVEVERLRGQLHGTLHRLAAFAPAYRVFGHELAIVPDDGIDYAGFRLNGRADRVDVDAESGRFVVVDYKGSAGRDYAAAMKDDGDVLLPGRIQADVYAQALRARLEGLHCAGALYLSYSARNRGTAFVGAADDTFDDGDFLGGASTVPMNFEAYLDAVEALVADGLSGLRRGEIAPVPRSASTCRFCPAVGCERRLS
ncbi:PD-(D/E)XK nuclease family protein [Adlercreutzia sp. R7]|uniref:PD-(D/E)XK nuclease family protein n=1 Tax=Adlercreutzia wanghongyangiae TaxID=3111451 RepID=A0ABU6IKG2_9ACTN|nr:PD-(D/E)XK nuclease family protein [Adlercreutzia sp. R7]